MGIALFWVLALASHWLRLSLRQGADPNSVREWYLGNEDDQEATVFLFERSWMETAEDAWGNLLHHTLALIVMAGLLVRTDVRRLTRNVLAATVVLSLPVTAAGPLLIRWAIPGAAGLYVFGLAALNLAALSIAALVFRDGVLRRGAGPRGVVGGSVVGVVAAFTLGVPAVSLAQEEMRVLMSAEQGRVEAFPEARSFDIDTVRVDQDLRVELEAELGRPIFEFQFVVHRALNVEGELLGYSLVTEERGKYRPVTMMVSIDPLGAVRRVSILVYRESRGGEVSRDRFLRQYRGRQSADPVRINRDIVNISGATISVIAVNHGVKKTLALIEQVYL